MNNYPLNFYIDRKQKENNNPFINLEDINFNYQTGYSTVQQGKFPIAKKRKFHELDNEYDNKIPISVQEQFDSLTICKRHKLNSNGDCIPIEFERNESKKTEATHQTSSIDMDLEKELVESYYVHHNNILTKMMFG